MDREALLIIDMSNDFVADDGNLTAGKPAQSIVPNILEAADTFLQEGNVVAICMDAHEQEDPHFQLWPKHNVKGTWGQDLFGELKDWYEAHRDNPHVLYIAKPEYDAFYNTNLDEQLKRLNVGTVHISGVCTDICDFLTAYGAYARGYRTIAYENLTATFTKNHETFLKQMEAIFQTEIRRW